MVQVRIDGIRTVVPEGTTVLEAAETMGIRIPTLCHYPGLSPFGGCRVCLVEVKRGDRSPLEASCTLPVDEGQVILTASRKVMEARRVVVELLLSSCPSSKTLQDLASQLGINRVRFKIKERECILCGRCVRYCKEQMRSGGIDFVGRGMASTVSSAFGTTPAECRNCGGCQWVCPVCERACLAGDLLNGLCGGCHNAAPVETCLVCTHCSESVGAGGHRVFHQ